MNPKLKFIKQFSKISISGVCKELNISSSNLYRGNTSQKNIDLVYITIIKKLKNIVDDVKEEIK